MAHLNAFHSMRFHGNRPKSGPLMVEDSAAYLGSDVSN